MTRILIVMYSIRISLMNAIVTHTKRLCVSITDHASHCLIRDLARRNALRALAPATALNAENIARIVCIVGMASIGAISLYTLYSTDFDVFTVARAAASK